MIKIKRRVIKELTNPTGLPNSAPASAPANQSSTTPADQTKRPMGGKVDEIDSAGFQNAFPSLSGPSGIQALFGWKRDIKKTTPASTINALARLLEQVGITKTVAVAAANDIQT